MNLASRGGEMCLLEYCVHAHSSRFPVEARITLQIIDHRPTSLSSQIIVIHREPRSRTR